MIKQLTATGVATVLLTLAAAGAQAQGVYRVVGPDGKVTFSDKPPPTAVAPAPLRGITAAGGAAAAGGSSLPYELRQIAARYPVTLYTASDCSPCVSARNLLILRGVPFTERTVNTNEDIEALQKLSGSNNLPFGTIGSQQLAGFQDSEWTQYLTAAGYPKASQLPSSYRAPAPTPLVAVKPAAPAPAAAAPAPAVNPPPLPADVPSGPTPSNPSGIRF